MAEVYIPPFLTAEEHEITEALRSISPEKLTEEQRSELVDMLKRFGVLSEDFVDGDNYRWEQTEEGGTFVAVPKTE